MYAIRSYYVGQLSGINFVLDEELKEKPITLLLEKGTFAQAMELILQMSGVGKKVLNGKTIIIYPQTKDKAKQYEDQIIQSFYLSHRITSYNVCYTKLLRAQLKHGAE